MKPTTLAQVLGTALATATAAAAVSIAEINGNHYNSPLEGTNVQNVTGLVTAAGENGIYIRSLEPDSDPATSESLYVFSRTIGSQTKVGDIVSMDGHIEQYRYAISTKQIIFRAEYSS